MTGIIKRTLQGGPFDGQRVFLRRPIPSPLKMPLGDRGSPVAIAPDLADQLRSGGRLVAIYRRVKLHDGFGGWEYRYSETVVDD